MMLYDSGLNPFFARNELFGKFEIAACLINMWKWETLRAVGVGDSKLFLLYRNQ